MSEMPAAAWKPTHHFGVTVDVVNLHGMMGVGDGWCARLRISNGHPDGPHWRGPTRDFQRQAEEDAVALRKALAVTEESQ